MIGNDIVDLALAKRDSNWRRKGYLDKIFTEHEQQLIRAAIHPDQVVWLLWSMKESAYKLTVRHTKKRVFDPYKIACHLTMPPVDVAEGLVFYHGTSQTKSVITPRYISTIAFGSDRLSANHTQIVVPFETADQQTHQHQIREQIRQYSAQLFDTPAQEISVINDRYGIPFLTVGDSLQIPLSISHHGHFGAFVLGLM